MKAKNYISGIGTILNIFPRYDAPKINIPYKTDEEALTYDWQAVGQDLRNVINNLKNIKTGIDQKHV